LGPGNRADSRGRPDVGSGSRFLLGDATLDRNGFAEATSPATRLFQRQLTCGHIWRENLKPGRGGQGCRLQCRKFPTAPACGGRPERCEMEGRKCTAWITPCHSEGLDEPMPCCRATKLEGACRARRAGREVVKHGTRLICATRTCAGRRSMGSPHAAECHHANRVGGTADRLHTGRCRRASYFKAPERSERLKPARRDP